MPKWLTILLIVLGCLVILGIGVIVAGVYVVNHYGRQFAESSQKSLKDGEEFGKKTDNAGCVAEGISQYKHDSSFSGMLSMKLFLGGCLKSSRSTPNFCSQVPRRFDFTESSKWQQEQCRAAGLGGDPNCQQIFDTVQQFCETGGNSSSDNDNRRP